MREAIKDKTFKIIGWFDHQANGDILVYDAVNKPLGKVTQSGTYDHGNQLISRERVPGLLLPKP